jgi:hypothetical protein
MDADSSLPEEWKIGLDAAWLWKTRQEFHADLLGLQFVDSSGPTGPKRPVVAFYGPSQVGKTGIILRLLGLDERRHKAVENVLRGGRGRGKSATATALRYSASTGASPEEWDQWEVPVLEPGPLGKIIQNTVRCDEQEARDRFGKLRKFLSEPRNGSHLPEDALAVGVPRSMFREGFDPEQSPILVDLPGEGSADIHEQHHVPLLVRKWLQAASSVVVVVRLDNVMEFSNLKFGLPHVTRNAWMYWTGDLVLVTTYSTSLDSVRSRLDELSGLEDLRNIIRYDELTPPQEAARGRLASDMLKASTALSESDLHEASRRLMALPTFPVELGDSLATLSTQHPRLYRKALPFLVEAMDGLREHVYAKAREETALLATSGLRLAVQAEHSERVSKAAELVASAERVVQKQQKRVSEHQSEIDSLEEERKSAKESMQKLASAAPNIKKSFKAHLSGEISKCRALSRDDIIPSELREAGNLLGRRIRTRAKELVLDLEGAELEGLRFDNWAQGVTAVTLCDHVDHYLDFYLWHSSSRKEEQGTVASRAKKLIDDIFSQFRIRLEAEMERFERSSKALDRRLAAALTDSRANLDREKKRMGEATAKLDAAREQLEEARRQRKLAVEAASESDTFLHMVRDAFAEEIAQQRRLMESTQDLSTKHEALVAWTAAVFRMERLEGVHFEQEGTPQ